MKRVGFYLGIQTIKINLMKLMKVSHMFQLINNNLCVSMGLEKHPLLSNRLALHVTSMFKRLGNRESFQERWWMWIKGLQVSRLHKIKIIYLTLAREKIQGVLILEQTTILIGKVLKSQNIMTTWTLWIWWINKDTKKRKCWSNQIHFCLKNNAISQDFRKQQLWVKTIITCTTKSTQLLRTLRNYNKKNLKTISSTEDSSLWPKLKKDRTKWKRILTISTTRQSRSRCSPKIN